MNQATLIDVPAHCGIDDDNQRFTTERALRWVKQVAGVNAFDLDVAACVESHHAPVWYGQQLDGSFVDGLRMPWFGRTFLQPPWSDIDPWAENAWAPLMSIARGPVEVIASLLPGNRTHRPWWQKYVEPYRDGRGRPPFGQFERLDVYFAEERFSYGGPGNPRGIGAPEPNFTSVALVWRR